jgi:hypothetical protein
VALQLSLQAAHGVKNGAGGGLAASWKFRL